MMYIKKRTQIKKCIKIFTKTKKIQNVIFGGKLGKIQLADESAFTAICILKREYDPFNLLTITSLQMVQKECILSCLNLGLKINVYYISSFMTSLCKMLTCFGINPV